MTDMSAKMGNWSRLRLLSAGVLILWAGGGAMHAAQINPGAWKIDPLIVPKPPSGLLATNPIALPSGTNPVAPSLLNVLTNLTDNNPATLVTLTNSLPNAIGLFIDLGQTNVVDRVFLIGGNHHLNLWPDNYTNRTNPPLGLIVVSVGNHGSMMKQVGEWTVPYDAGNPVDTEVDLRFSPAAGRYVQIQLQTNVIWGVNHWPGYALASQPPAPANLTWNVGEVEIYGFSGPVTNLNAVVCNSPAQPLQIAASDLSYYLGELTGTPHPIIASSQTNLYPGRIYRIADLASLAPDYNTMMRNIASGALPTNLVVSVVGREVQFSGWPYRCVLWGVWEFLERQGVRWVYPDGHGDFVPTGTGVSLNMLPLQVKPSATSIFASWDTDSLQPWSIYIKQSVRQGYLYPWRNRWNRTGSGDGPLGGAEIPTVATPVVALNSDYSEQFVGYPHNFNSVVPNRILEIPSYPYTNWWGWATTNPASIVNPTNNPYGSSPNFTMDDSTLISWVANKLVAVAASYPNEYVWPMDSAYFNSAYNLLPIDSSTYSQDPYTIASNGPVQLNPEPWVKLYNQAYSGAYYSFVSAVASQVQQQGSKALVGALAYADVFAPPANIISFPSNVQMAVCLYGSPNLPMSSPVNSNLKAAFDDWHTRCSHLATYDYALLHDGYGEPDPRLPVPLVAGVVGTAQYLASIGALDGLCQATPESLPYNPWNFYAYPRIRWNTNQTASQLETEFFSGYFREAAAPMLAYYQGLENYQVANNINMHYMNYVYGIMPESFPLGVLAAMQTNLQAAKLAATNWYVIARVNDMTNAFNWLITNAGLAGVSLTNMAPYPIIGSTTNPYTVNLTNMAKFTPGYSVMGNHTTLYSGPPSYLYLYFQGQVQETFNVATAGVYTVAITAKGVAEYNVWPAINVYFGAKKGTVSVNTTTNSTYSLTFTVPTGAWNLMIELNNPVAWDYGRTVTITNIQITRQ